MIATLFIVGFLISFAAGMIVGSNITVYKSKPYKIEVTREIKHTPETHEVSELWKPF